jgi:uncharacterized protein YjbJ (UPF0337 family)
MVRGTRQILGKSGGSYDSSSEFADGRILAGRHSGSEICNQGNAMNKDQVQGRVEEAKGAIKQATGHVTGKPDLEDRGTMEKAAGKVQKTYGDVKEQVKDAAKKPQ